MNSYKYIYITYHKFVFLALSKFITGFPGKLEEDYTIDMDNNNLNLIEFTLETFYSKDIKPLLFSFNQLNIYSSLDSINDLAPNYLYLFDSEGKLFGLYVFHIHNLDNESEELGFKFLVLSLSQDILKKCVYEIMRKNGFLRFTSNYKFYMNISNKNLLKK